MQSIFRNQLSWKEDPLPQPEIRLRKENDCLCLEADEENLHYSRDLPFSYSIEKRFQYGSKDGNPLFTNNESDKEKLWKVPNDTPYLKDAFHRKIIQNEDSTHPDHRGTKAALHYHLTVDAKSSTVLYFCFTDKPIKDPLKDVQKIIDQRKAEADEYFEALQPKSASVDEKLVQRQALAGMTWSQQIYLYDVGVWLVGDNPKDPPPKERKEIRNNHWRHLNSMRIFSMPDKWEYPWFAAWDLAYHCVALSLVDISFAKRQLWYLLFDQFQHPSRQVPAYEWEFSDVNPPVQGWAALKIFHLEKERFGKEDYDFLERCFHKLILNFSWGVNKIDHEGHNVFEGGFLGLDNNLVDRSLQTFPWWRKTRSDGWEWMDGNVLSQFNENSIGSFQKKSQLSVFGHQILRSFRLYRRFHAERILEGI